MSQWQTLSSTQVEENISVNILNKVALGASRIAESQDVRSILVGVDIGSSEDSLVPGATEVN